MDNHKHYAQLAKISYLKPEQRHAEAEKLGYKIGKQDADRVLFTREDGNNVVAFRGTDLHHPKNAVRDILTDASILIGQEKKTPRYLASEKFVQSAIADGFGDNLTAVGHSLGGHQALHIGKEYGVKTHAYNPAFSIPDVAKSFRDRVIGRRRYDNLHMHTTGTDPISMGTLLSFTGKVFRRKTKHDAPSSHSLDNFV